MAEEDSETMLIVGSPQPSRYMRTTWMISAQEVLKFPDSSRIRFFGSAEADELAEQVRKRNVFARHSRENNFYVQRVRELANHSIIEVFRPGEPKNMADEAYQISSVLEKITILSSIIATRKTDLQRKLGISARPRTETDFIVSPQFRYLRSRAKSAPAVQGIRIDRSFCKRFTRCGFDVLAAYCECQNELASRVLKSLDWLFESRVESRLPASVVKTSIALESLLVFSESESLAQSLSERAAFIISPDPNRRYLVSRILKRFYDVRSGVVHGSPKKARKLTLSLLETVDRLVVLMCLTIAANPELWTTTKALYEWCERQRWGEPWSDIKIPFPDLYLKNVIASGEQELELRI